MIQEKISKINKILSSFKIKAECNKYYDYKHLEFYDLIPLDGFKINRLNSCLDEISLILKSKDIISNIIFDKGIINLQLVKHNPSLLKFEDVYQKIPVGTLPFILGEKFNGDKFWVDFVKNPHLLIAGTTGSGKSVLLHTIIKNCLLFNNVDLYLIDTKKVEFSKYTNKATIANDYDSALLMLENLVNTMEQRFDLFQKINIKSLEEKQILNNIILIIDEAADIMIQDKDNLFQKLLIKLASKCRAAGIYITMATQRPSVNVITGAIKANFPARLSCKVASKTDSKVILDEYGAEKLLGKGDCLFKNSEINLVRAQIAL